MNKREEVIHEQLPYDGHIIWARPDRHPDVPNLWLRVKGAAAFAYLITHLLVYLSLLLLSLTSAFAQEGTQSEKFIWTPASGPVHHYEVEISYDDGQTFEPIASTIAEMSEITLDIPLTSLGSVTVRVRAADAEGRVGPWSDTSATYNFNFGKPGNPEVGKLTIPSSLVYHVVSDLQPNAEYLISIEGEALYRSHALGDGTLTIVTRTANVEVSPVK